MGKQCLWVKRCKAKARAEKASTLKIIKLKKSE